MDILVQYLTIDELAEQSKTQIAIIEDRLSNRKIKSYVRFSSRPSLWIYKYSEEYAKYRYVEEVTPTGFLEILDYNLVVWTSTTSGVIRLPDESILSRKHINYKPEKHEVYQFKDDQGHYYRIRAGEEVCIFRHDVLIRVKEGGTDKSTNRRHTRMSLKIDEICREREKSGLQITPTIVWEELIKSIGVHGSCCLREEAKPNTDEMAIAWSAAGGRVERLTLRSLGKRLSKREKIH